MNIVGNSIQILKYVSSKLRTVNSRIDKNIESVNKRNGKIGIIVNEEN